MATVQLDTLKDLAAEERGGVIFTLERSVLVTLLDSEGADDAVGVITEALDAVELGYGDLAGASNNLLLTRRSIRMIDQDKAEVHVFYEHVAESDLQRLDDPANGILIFKVSCGLEQTETAVNYRGEPVWAKYHYPDGTEDYKAPDDSTMPADKKRAGQDVVQGGKVPLRTISKHATLDGLLAADDPGAFANGILKKTNADLWLGGKPGTWLCTGADYVAWDLDAEPIIYKWSLTFEYKSDGEFVPEIGNEETVELGWDPQAVFCDPDTGAPPADWKAQGAYAFTTMGADETVLHYPVVWLYERLDFNAYLSDAGIPSDW